MATKLYGVMASQPVRAVAWLMKAKGIPYELVWTMPGKDTKTPSFAELNPAQTVPVLEDNGEMIWESNAILVYLATKYKMEDMLPTDALGAAKVHQWLNWHHANSRLFTLTLFAPFARPDLKLPPPKPHQMKKLEAVLNIMESQLVKTKFLASNQPTIADLACYEDVWQCSEQNLDLFKFDKFPHIARWANDLESALPGHEATHKNVLGKLKEYFSNMKSSSKL